MMVLPGLLGAVLIAVILQDAFEVMLLPRRVLRRVRLVGLFFQATWRVWSRAARALPAGPRRERLLSVYGPLSMVLLFILWSSSLILGFGLIQWALHAGRRDAPSLAMQVYGSGVTFFTLGYGDIIPQTWPARALAVAEAGTGFGLIAVVIGYLPVLYQLFSRREAHVLQLDGRAGSPPTAEVLLRRHAGALEQLDAFLREWEVWAAELLESHLSYPMLVYYRSQHDNQSWLMAVSAILDTCALILVGAEDLHPLQARMTFTMVRQVVVEMSHSFSVSPSRYTGGDRLPHDAYLQLEQALAEAGLHWRGGSDVEEMLAALRATYEPLLDGLSSRLLLPLQGWSPEATASDHWARGPRGLMAQRLIEDLAAGAMSAADPALPSGYGRGSRWRRLRARLRP